MISEGRSRYSRYAPRRAVPTVLEAEVVLCDSTTCRARIVDEQGGSLGLMVRGEDAARALAHRSCCIRKTIGLRVPGSDGGIREVAAQLIHVSSGEDATKVGVGFLVSCLDMHDIQHLLSLWERFREDADA